MAFPEKRGKWWRGRFKKLDGSYGSVTRDAEGQQFRTASAATERASEIEVDIRRKVWVDPVKGKVTVESWSKVWIESVDVAEGSLPTYRSRLRAVILPAWGSVQIRDVTTVAYNTWLKELRGAGRAKNYIDGIHTVMRTMFEDAKASGIRGDNPIPDRSIRRRGRFRPEPDSAPRIIATPRQTLLVARNGLSLRGLNLYALILTSAYTGMRISEVAGLTVDQLVLEDLDGSGCRILGVHQLQYLARNVSLIRAKYDSKRDLIIPPFLAELLTQVIEANKSVKAVRTKKSHQRFGGVFLAPWGGPQLIGGYFYTDSFSPAVNGRAARLTRPGHRAEQGIRPVLGVAGMTPHELRHSHKTWLDEGALPRVAVEHRMGHVVPGVEGVYSHTTLPMELKIAEHLQTLWEQSLRPVVDRREFGLVPSSEDRSES